MTARRTEAEGPLLDFITSLRGTDVKRVAGTAVFPHPTMQTTPLALRANVERNHVLHQRIVIISAHALPVPHVAPGERLRVDGLGYADDGIIHVTVRYGFQDDADLPGALRLVHAAGLDAELDTQLDVDSVSYFLSRATLRRTNGPGMAGWRKRLFIVLARNATDPGAYFGLPKERTVVMGLEVDI